MSGTDTDDEQIRGSVNHAQQMWGSDPIPLWQSLPRASAIAQLGGDESGYVAIVRAAQMAGRPGVVSKQMEREKGKERRAATGVGEETMRDAMAAEEKARERHHKLVRIQVLMATPRSLRGGRQARGRFGPPGRSRYLAWRRGAEKIEKRAQESGGAPCSGSK